MSVDCMFIQTSVLVRAFVISWWRRRRTPDPDWTPLDGCPSCGKAQA